MKDEIHDNADGNDVPAPAEDKNDDGVGHKSDAHQHRHYCAVDWLETIVPLVTLTAGGIN